MVVMIMFNQYYKYKPKGLCEKKTLKHLTNKTRKKLQ